MARQEPTLSWTGTLWKSLNIFQKFSKNVELNTLTDPVITETQRIEIGRKAKKGPFSKPFLAVLSINIESPTKDGPGFHQFYVSRMAVIHRNPSGRRERSNWNQSGLNLVTINKALKTMEVLCTWETGCNFHQATYQIPAIWKMSLLT